MASHVQLAVEIRSIEKGSTSNTEEMPKKLGITGTMVANTEILTQKSMELRASQSSETVTVVKINKIVNPVQKPADRAEQGVNLIGAWTNLFKRNRSATNGMA